MRQLKRDERGVGTIELALILPVLILLTVGFLDLARALNAAIVVGGASQEGAHYAVLNPAAAPSAIASAARARVQPLSPGSVTVTAEYYDNASARFVPWPSTGIPASSPTPTGVVVRVSVSYPWSAVSTLVDSFFSGTGSRSSPKHVVVSMGLEKTAPRGRRHSGVWWRRRESFALAPLPPTDRLQQCQSPIFNVSPK